MISRVESRLTASTAASKLPGIQYVVVNRSETEAWVAPPDFLQLMNELVGRLQTERCFLGSLLRRQP